MTLRQKDPSYLYSVLRTEDEDAVKALVKNVFSGFLEGDYWDWKFKRNPDFDPSLVVVAEKDGAIVGCNHWLVRELRFSSKLKARTILGADIAVDTKHRRQGIGKSLLLFLRSSEAFKEKGAVLSYMFPNPDMINPLYRPAVYYIAAPNKTTRYTKVLNWSKLKKRLEILNRRLSTDNVFKEKMSSLKIKAVFKIGEAPVLPLRIDERGVEVNEAVIENTDVTFRIDLATLQSIGGAKHKTLRLIKAFLQGKLKVTGKLSTIVRLYRNFWIFREIFSLRN